MLERLERLEAAEVGGGLQLVWLEDGRTEEEALHEHFGPDGPPRGAEVILLTYADWVAPKLPVVGGVS